MSDTVKRPLTLTPALSGGYAVLMAAEGQGNLIVFAHQEVDPCLEHMKAHFSPPAEPKGRAKAGGEG